MQQLRLNFALRYARTAFNIENVLEIIAMPTALDPELLLISNE